MGELSLEHSEVWKIVLWWALFVENIWCFSYEISEELCAMTLKGDTKFKGKLTGGLKYDIRNLVNFHGSSWKSENLHFEGVLLSIAYKVSTKKSTEKCSLMTLKSDPNFEEELNFCLKNDTRNLVNFNTSSGKSENLHFAVGKLAHTFVKSM